LSSNSIDATMNTFHIVLVLATACTWTSSAVAQTAPTDEPTTTAEPAPESPADAAFKSLEKELRAVNTSLLNKGGVEPMDKPILKSLSDRVDAFSKQFPDDERGPAAQLMIAEWLSEDGRIDDLYQELLAKSPSNQQLRLAFARRLKEVNRYAEAVDVLMGQTFDDSRVVEAMKLLSECLFAENRFSEALETLKSLTPEQLAASPVLKPQIDEDARMLEEYVELWSSEQALRQAEEEADDLPRVVLATARGPITLELFENEAPNTVANFIKLAEEGFYNGTKFHRVIANFMAQGGDPNSKPDASAGAVPGLGGPGYTIADEQNLPNARKHFAGSLSMANTGAPNSGGSQFFITHQPTPHLNGKHTVFGRVTDGLSVARSIKQDDELESVAVLRKRNHDYLPQTIAELGTIQNPIDITMPTSTAPATPE
jgi:peptidyl-prolyl cis-trans isomerase B (cyclophilin B)